MRAAVIVSGSGGGVSTGTPASTPATVNWRRAQAPSRDMLTAGAGTFARVYVTETEGVSLMGKDLTPEGVAAHFDAISDPSSARAIASGFEQADKLAAAAMRVMAE